MKAFLVNRVGDFGFLLGIAAVLTISTASIMRRSYACRDGQ